MNLLALIAVLVYANLEPAQYLTDKDILVNKKIFSPDENYVILNYVYDIGALGYTTMFTAVVPVKDESENLSKFRLPIAYKKAKWLSNDSIAVEVDIRPYLAKMKEFKQEVLRIGDIRIIVQTKGFNTSSPLFVEHRALSPDGRKELVAYRYRDSMASGHLHISIINEGETIPALGNLYIGNEYRDYVYFGEWRTPDKIALYTDDKYMAEQHLLGHAGVEVDFVEKQYPISGVEPGWYHNPRFGSGQYLERELNRYGRSGSAVVKDKFYYADGLRTGEMDILYTYHYNGKTYSAVFREKSDHPWEVNTNWRYIADHVLRQ